MLCSRSRRRLRPNSTRSQRNRSVARPEFLPTETENPPSSIVSSAHKAPPGIYQLSPRSASRNRCYHLARSSLALPRQKPRCAASHKNRRVSPESARVAPHSLITHLAPHSSFRWRVETVFQAGDTGARRAPLSATPSESTVRYDVDRRGDTDAVPGMKGKAQPCSGTTTNSIGSC